MSKQGKFWWGIVWLIAGIVYAVVAFRACDYASAAAAKRWVCDGKFDAGWYMVCANFNDVNEAPYCSGTLYFNGTQEQSDQICDALNIEDLPPDATEEQLSAAPFYFIWKNTQWQPYAIPCKYVGRSGCADGADCA